jgi:hypothetical protein
LSFGVRPMAAACAALSAKRAQATSDAVVG